MKYVGLGLLGILLIILLLLLIAIVRTLLMPNRILFSMNMSLQMTFHIKNTSKTFMKSWRCFFWILL